MVKLAGTALARIGSADPARAECGRPQRLFNCRSIWTSDAPFAVGYGREIGRCNVSYDLKRRKWKGNQGSLADGVMVSLKSE
jgi:hypothetical protein